MQQKKQQRLLELMQKLPDQAADSLLDYAEFLAGRYQAEDSPGLAADAVMLKPSELTIGSALTVKAEAAKPAEIPRPETESVIGAVKRLSATYHMLSKDKMLQVTAGLVSESLMGGRDTVEVIDELEAVFLQQYEIHTEENSSQ